MRQLGPILAVLFLLFGREQAIEQQTLSGEPEKGVTEELQSRVATLEKEIAYLNRISELEVEVQGLRKQLADCEQVRDPSPHAAQASEPTLHTAMLNVASAAANDLAGALLPMVLGILAYISVTTGFARDEKLKKAQHGHSEDGGSFSVQTFSMSSRPKVQEKRKGDCATPTKTPTIREECQEIPMPQWCAKDVNSRAEPDNGDEAAEVAADDDGQVPEMPGISSTAYETDPPPGLPPPFRPPPGLTRVEPLPVFQVDLHSMPGCLVDDPVAEDAPIDLNQAEGDKEKQEKEEEEEEEDQEEEDDEAVEKKQADRTDDGTEGPPNEDEVVENAGADGGHAEDLRTEAHPLLREEEEEPEEDDEDEEETEERSEPEEELPMDEAEEEDDEQVENEEHMESERLDKNHNSHGTNGKLSHKRPKKRHGSTAEAWKDKGRRAKKKCERDSADSKLKPRKTDIAQDSAQRLGRPTMVLVALALGALLGGGFKVLRKQEAILSAFVQEPLPEHCTADIPEHVTVMDVENKLPMKFADTKPSISLHGPCFLKSFQKVSKKYRPTGNWYWQKSLPGSGERLSIQHQHEPAISSAPGKDDAAGATRHDDSAVVTFLTDHIFPKFGELNNLSYDWYVLQQDAGFVILLPDPEAHESLLEAQRHWRPLFQKLAHTFYPRYFMTYASTFDAQSREWILNDFGITSFPALVVYTGHPADKPQIVQQIAREMTYDNLAQFIQDVEDGCLMWVHPLLTFNDMKPFTEKEMPTCPVRA